MFKGKKLLIILIVLIGVFYLLFNSRNQNTVQDIKETVTPSASIAPVMQNVEALPVVELFSKTESQVRNDYSEITKNFNEGSLVPSKKIKITGFDLPQANVQVDFNVATNKPVYAGYSFSANPLDESTAWAVTGFNKPTAVPEGNPGVRNRTVQYWQNIDEIKPFKMIQIIKESNGKVGKISFSLEDLDTAQSSKSLYYVPN